MASQNQCVISLSKLTLPESLNLKKLTISANTSSQEIFIQNYKNVKTNTINFYRQKIFLTTPPQQLSFKVYQVNDSSNKVLIKQLETLTSDLLEIKGRQTPFKTVDQEFILEWESWIFTEDSEDFNDYTQRDYSQLDRSFENEEDSNESQLLKDSNIDKQLFQKIFQPIKKRSSSTDGSSSLVQKKSDHVPGDFNKRLRVVENKVRSPIKEKNTIKSHLYTSFVKMASNLFSESDS